MGRQVNFYMTYGDEAEFLDLVLKSGKVVILPRVGPTVPFEPVKVPPRPSSDYAAGWPYFLVNHSVSSNIVTKLGGNGRYLDPFASSVIEYSPSTTNGNILYPGRIWAEFAYFNENTKSNESKEAQFEKWYETLANWIRTRYRPFSYTAKMTGQTVPIAIAGPEAQGFLEKGGMFALNLINIKKKLQGEKCPACEGPLEDVTVLLNDSSVRHVHKCVDLKCSYGELQ